MTTRRYTVSGLVQGVGFRWFVRRIADAFGITGTVQNLPDGSVEIIATGFDDQHQSFREQVEIGPASARVDHVAIQPMELRRFADFHVLR
ncbi:MAG: acylphosphatase [Armatimonadetes bacterium]|nr:acylphosphatase [Armatimonadota bacterium]